MKHDPSVGKDIFISNDQDKLTQELFSQMKV